jgi:histidinol phosphatase-like enzyme
MKAIFIHKDSLLRDSGLSVQAEPDSWRLVPATLEAVRTLAADDTLVFLYAGAGGDDAPQGLQVLARQVEAAGGRVDGLISCPHPTEEPCACWGARAGALWEAARLFPLHLNECYVIGDGSTDVAMAYAAGARPIMVLNSRSLGEVLGRLPEHKDFPVAQDLGTAAGYIGVEEDINRQLGRPRSGVAPRQPVGSLYEGPAELPDVAVISPLARNLQAQLTRSRAQLRDIGRWLSFFVLGAVGLSLGIAYLLTHLYRMQPFPGFVYYLTLQFISRPLRGALFIAWGCVIIAIGVRSLYRSAGGRLSGRREE